MLILGFITCGLYLIYWNIKTAEVLNAVAGRGDLARGRRDSRLLLSGERVLLLSVRPVP